MQSVLVIGFNEERSNQIKIARQVSADFESEDVRECKYVLVVSNQRIPVWLGEISTVSFSPEKSLQHATLSLSKVVFLEGAWDKVSVIIRGVDFNLGKAVNLDVDTLFAAGTALTQAEGESVPVLTAAEAVRRLAWTYGVQDDQVKVSIQF